MQVDDRISAVSGTTFRSGKNYCHNIGLSCCFRQWRAKEHSHCSFLHGYALQVELTFKARELDERNWVQDFGGLKEVKKWLEKTFDHKTLVAQDDPQISIFKELAIAGIIDLNVVPHVGCEYFARMVYDHLKHRMDFWHLESVTIREHAGNWASYGE